MTGLAQYPFWCDGVFSQLDSGRLSLVDSAARGVMREIST